MNLAGYKGKHIVRIESDSPEIKKLSDLGENWELDCFCPNCNRLLVFTKSRVNKKNSCKCGQVIFIQIDSPLL